MKSLESFYKSLADETRIRILNLLRRGPLCVCQITGILELPQAKVSRHLAKLRDAGLVHTKRKEQFMEYSLDVGNDLLMTTVGAWSDVVGESTLERDRQRLAWKDYYLSRCRGSQE